MKKFRLSLIALLIVSCVVLFTACSLFGGKGNGGDEDGDGTHTHTWGGWGQSTATCMSAGIETRVCSDPTHTETRPVAALGHNWGDWEVTSPTSETRTCQRDENHTETRPYVAESAGLLFTQQGSGPTTYFEVSMGSAVADEIGIPATHQGYPVTRIANSGFAGKSIKSVYIADGVASIGVNAFQGCSSLIEMTVPDSVTSIGNGAFSGCTSLSITWHYNYSLSHGSSDFDKYVSNVIFPEGLTSITNNVFVGFIKLNNIVIPAGITTIWQYAFYMCSGLNTVYYEGADASAWSAIDIKSNNAPLTDATRYYYSETQKAGNYWRYVAGVPTAW